MKQELLFGQPPDFEHMLQVTAFALRSTVHTMLQATPGQLVFGRNMIIPTDIAVDWQQIRNRRIACMACDNLRENHHRVDHTYEPGDYIYLRNDHVRRGKHDQTNFGPYRVTQVGNNGTLVIQKKSSNYFGTIHIRRVSQLHLPNDSTIVLWRRMSYQNCAFKEENR